MALIEDRAPSSGQGGADAPYTRAVAVTPNDSTNLTFRTTALLATVAGNVNVYMAGTTTGVVLPIAAGVALRVRVDRVLAASTTATGIVALD
jgi:hypothetical protein